MQKKKALIIMITVCMVIAAFAGIGNAFGADDESTIRIPVKKIWNGNAPKNITVSLMSYGEKVEDLTLSRETGWEGNFTLPRAYAGTRLEIVESQSSDYVLESATNPTVTRYEEHVNKVMELPTAQPETQKPSAKPAVPNTGDGNSIPTLMFVFAAAGICAMALKVKKERQ